MKNRHICWKTIVAIIVSIAVIALFFWNLKSAKIGNCSSNEYTAISGWVSFLATAGVGVISVIQTHQNNKENGRLSKSLNDYVDSIDYSIWRANMPIVLINLDKKSFLESVYYQISETGMEIRKRDELFFRLVPKDGNLGYAEMNLCTLHVQFQLENASEQPLLSIKCISVSLRNSNCYKEYINSIEYVQGYVPGHSSIIGNLYFIDKIGAVDTKMIEIILHFEIEDARGNKQKKMFHLFSFCEYDGERMSAKGTPSVFASSVERIKE